MKIAVCITTRNRRDIFYKTHEEITKNLPCGHDIDVERFVVDDASDTPALWTNYRFERNAGIPAAKNKCLRLAYDWGADHIFLFDDDTYPIDENWWKPYVKSKEHHLMYQFKLPGKPAGDMREIYRNKKVVAYTHTRGAMIYVDRLVLDTVGGMDIAYDEGMYEHTDWTNRIHNAGLTTYRAMDVPNSHKLIHCLDQDGVVKSSLSSYVRSSNIYKNALLYRKSKTSKQYKEF